MRCLTCLRVDGCPKWCLTPNRPQALLTATRTMPAVETDDRPPEMPVVRRSARRRVPVWSVVCVSLGMILAGLSVVTLGILDHWTRGGVTTMLDEAKPGNGNERPTQPKPSGGNTRPTTGR